MPLSKFQFAKWAHCVHPCARFLFEIICISVCKISNVSPLPWEFKRFIPENLYIIFEISRNFEISTKERKIWNNVRPKIRFTVNRSTFAVASIAGFHGRRAKNAFHAIARILFASSQSSFALFPRDNENGRVIYILYTEKGGGRKTSRRSLCF